MLAILTKVAGEIPPFQLLAMTFGIAFTLTVCKWIVLDEPMLTYTRQPPLIWLIGISGLFGYHFFYFVALANAPAAEASLIAYLWPLLIVLFSSLLPGERLKKQHLIGCLIAMSGCWVLIGGDSTSFSEQYILGYLSAVVCAFVWASYSVAGRLVKQVPTATVGWFCGATALLGLLCHLIWEATIWPTASTQWLGILGLGIGPVGIAFFTWDYGVKHGDLPLLGTLAYMTPLLSTLCLVGFGYTEPTPRIFLACLMIICAAIVASLELPRRKSANKK